jgi:hypothetical protein
MGDNAVTRKHSKAVGANQLRFGPSTTKGTEIMEPRQQQGQPLDPSLGVSGDWVEHGYIFLFMSPPDQPLMQLTLPNGKVCLGFNAVHLAQGIHMHPGDLILNNRIRSLSVRCEPGVLGRGAARTTDFIFELSCGIGIRVPVSFAPIAGSA